MTMAMPLVGADWRPAGSSVAKNGLAAGNGHEEVVGDESII